jgi:DNA-binding PucR family transcriptional regulator
VAQTFRHLDAAVVRFAAAELLALLTEDAGRASRFLARELGGLAATDPATWELRRTVRVYLDSHSPQTAACRLFVARNTVNYRLRRDEQLRGRPLTERQLELGVALMLAEAIQPDRDPGQTGTVAGL